MHLFLFLAPAHAACDASLPTDELVLCLNDELAATQEELADTQTFLTVVLGALSGVSSTQASNQIRLAGLENDVDDLEAEVIAGLSDYLGVDRSTDSVIFEGANVFVRSGAGSTSAAVNGLGNLVVGYDEDGGDDKSGSHNLVIGPDHTYSSYGALISGEDHVASAPSVSVTGGLSNTAGADYASVAGGYGNEASGRGAAVAGGSFNDATALYAAVSGGGANLASGDYSSVTGGVRNTASGYHGWIGGGRWGLASGQFSSVAGGGSSASGNEAFGDYSSVLGGLDNLASGDGASVAGGRENTASGDHASVLGGAGVEVSAAEGTSP
jgi:hypothetical protein